MQDNPFSDGFRLIDGTTLNDALANPVWSVAPAIAATDLGDVNNSTKIVETISRIVSATPNAGVVLSQAQQGQIVLLKNTTLNTVIVFAAKGSNIDGIPGNVGIPLSSGASQMFVAFSNGAWSSFFLNLGTTGTGLVVLNNGPTIISPTLNTPTLVTPVLGTPTSGDLVNCLNLPQTGVTGLVSALAGKAPTVHTHVSTQITDSTVPGRALLTAATTAAQLTALGATAAGQAIFTAADAAAQRVSLGLGTAATQNTGSVANTVPLLDASGQLLTERNASSAGWGAVTKSVGVSNESGVYFDASNNSSFEGRNAAGVLQTRWETVNPSAHLLDGLPAYVCRAWVNFNGTGVAAIRASGNVSSVVRNGTGDYTINFITAMPDANYAAIANYTTTNTLSGSNNDGQAICWGNSTTSMRVYVVDGAAGARDALVCSVAIFR